jgi:hypothetical protein
MGSKPCGFFFLSQATCTSSTPRCVPRRVPTPDVPEPDKSSPPGEGLSRRDPDGNERRIPSRSHARSASESTARLGTPRLALHSPVSPTSGSTGWAGVSSDAPAPVSVQDQHRQPPRPSAASGRPMKPTRPRAAPPGRGSNRGPAGPGPFACAVRAFWVNHRVSSPIYRHFLSFTFAKLNSASELSPSCRAEHARFQ